MKTSPALANRCRTQFDVLRHAQLDLLKRFGPALRATRSDTRALFAQRQPTRSSVTSTADPGEGPCNTRRRTRPRSWRFAAQHQDAQAELARTFLPPAGAPPGRRSAAAVAWRQQALHVAQATVAPSRTGSGRATAPQKMLAINRSAPGTSSSARFFRQRLLDRRSIASLPNWAGSGRRLPLPDKPARQPAGPPCFAQACCPPPTSRVPVDHARERTSNLSRRPLLPRLAHGGKVINLAKTAPPLRSP